MLPSVASIPQVQPHQHLDRYHGIGPPSSHLYGLNNSAFPQPHNGVSTGSFHLAHRARFQYAHPVQRHNSNGFTCPKPGSLVAGEHTLRRKTPSGTLAAGYDGTPGDTTIELPANKHILVSSREAGQLHLSQSGLQMGDWQQPTVGQPSAAHLNYPPNFNPLPGDAIHDASGSAWIPPLNYTPGIDAPPGQTIPLQPSQFYLLQNGPYVPTVLPGALQQCVGPTASAGTGPYGPYWPDGAYIPYRPAALRDPRFNLHPGLPFYNPGRACSWDSQPTGLSDVGYTWNRSGQNIPNGDVLLKSNFPPRHLARGSLDPLHGQQFLPYGSQRGSIGTCIPLLQLGQESLTLPDPPGPPAGHTIQTLLPPASTSTVNAELKERVLSWAHCVYVDLLATIHQARRNNISKADNYSQAQRHLKPSIYPKPPRQSGLDFSQIPAQDTPCHNSYPPNNHGLQPRRLSVTSAHQGEVPGFEASHHFKGPSLVQHQHDVSDIQIAENVRHASQLSISMPASHFSASLLDENSIMNNAASALDTLSNLCSESRWEWIDGMLLGGCLAYGLGDYHKAMRWYSRIMARDKTHVEAMSNLAATFLALDRHEDALQHWLRAVKLRPSYFEAVEHLIGLLCGSHRGKEAVNVIDYVQNSLRRFKGGECFTTDEHTSGAESDADSRSSSISEIGSYEKATFDYDDDSGHLISANLPPEAKSAGFATSGYNIPGADNGRMLALVHAKGNLLYALGDNAGAAAAFEDAILVAAGRRRHGIQNLIRQILAVFSNVSRGDYSAEQYDLDNTVLLYPNKALQTAKMVFPPCGTPPGLKYVDEGISRKAAISTASNCLLSLAKIYQDGMSNVHSLAAPRACHGVRDILALYYLSLSLQPSPSTANNVGILLAGIQGNTSGKGFTQTLGSKEHPEIPGVVPGSGMSLALSYYQYGLQLDSRHAHLYTNLGSLLKDTGLLQPAIRMYEQAVQCDPNFDIALANLANAVKDAGKINNAVAYYKRAVKVNPEFAEAVCGLANALNSVCSWTGRGGIVNGYGFRDQWHVDDQGVLHDACSVEVSGGWMKRVVDIVEKQLREGERWACGILDLGARGQLCAQVERALTNSRVPSQGRPLSTLIQSWAGQKWEGARVVKLVERTARLITWQWYQDRYVHGRNYPLARYQRPRLPPGFTVPNTPTVLPFHTFTTPLSAKQVRQISQRNGLRISCSALRSPWLPDTVYKPPSPPNPYLKVGYVSSDFNNHPLAHLMQSVFGLHNPSRVKAYCYATTASDKSIYRQRIEKEAPVFYDASGWPVNRLVQQIVDDGIHILVNLNGYTRGARNEVFAARPAPINMSFMGFAGTLGAEWCDYILADQISIPPETLSPSQRHMRIGERLLVDDHSEELEDWVYEEKIIFTRDTFFCCDHRQSAPDAQEGPKSWEEEQAQRWKMRKELFPHLQDNIIVLGNFNQLYKIEPTTFRTWLRILARVPNAVLWLLRFPDRGEQNLREAATAWAGREIASRIIFTDVAPKNAHISRAMVLDLFLDTPECNAHTTATDVLWSGTPLLTYPRYKYKMCSRMASSILTSALPDTEAGQRAREELIAVSDEDYEEKAIRLCLSPQYRTDNAVGPQGRLTELRKLLFEERWRSRLFDTKRWVRDLEEAYEQVWRQWTNGKEEDVWL